MFAHTVTRPVLVVGPIATPSDVARLHDVAREISYELGITATYATHADHTVTDFSAVYLTGTVAELRDAPTLVLVAEALTAGMDVHEPLTADEVTECPCGLVSRCTRPLVDERGEVRCANCLGEDACAWCAEEFDMEDAEIVEGDDTWYPLHAGCLDGIRRERSSSLAPLVA